MLAFLFQLKLVLISCSIKILHEKKLVLVYSDYSFLISRYLFLALVGHNKLAREHARDAHKILLVHKTSELMVYEGCSAALKSMHVQHA